MKEYIFGERNGIYIIDLGKTVKLFKEAEDFVTNLAAEGKTILFVGTKRQAQDVIAEEAVRSGMFFVNQRWLGGLLTNFNTIQRSLARLRDLESMATDGRYDTLSKKEVARLEKERRKLEKNLEGIRGMARLPDAVFIVDTRKEKIAVDEARKLKIPIIGIVDTNCDPDEVDFRIPGNDDALRAIRLFAARIADAVNAGRGTRESAQAEAAAAHDDGGDEKRGARRGGGHVASLIGPAGSRVPSSGVRVHRFQSLGSDAGHDGPAFFLPVDNVRSRQRSHVSCERRRTAGPWSTHMEISAALVKKLRDMTGAGFMECKAALTEANGDIEAATTLLRKRGLASAAKKAGRTTSQGSIGSYIHMGGKIGVLVEVNCESDFVARTDQFSGLVKELAMHIAAADPKYVRRDEVPGTLLDTERDIYRAQFTNSGKPEDVIKKIVEGKLESYYEQVVLLDQKFVRDPNVKISQLIADATAKMGENITVSRFARYKIGESATE
jgi:small subunit ribosomal protein S2